MSFQVLKGGHEAPTKPKGRPKKNSIPTTEEIEAEERRMQAEAEERMRREAERTAAASASAVAAAAAALARGTAEAPQLQPQDLSSLTQRAAAMEAADDESALPRQREGEAAAS